MKYPIEVWSNSIVVKPFSEGTNVFAFILWHKQDGVIDPFTIIFNLLEDYLHV